MGIGLLVVAMVCSISLSQTLGYQLFQGPVFPLVALYNIISLSLGMMYVFWKELAQEGKAQFKTTEKIVLAFVLAGPTLVTAYRLAEQTGIIKMIAEQLFASQHPLAGLNPTPVAMLPFANLTLLGIALQILVWTNERGHWKSLSVGAIALTVLGLNSFIIFGHGYDIPILYEFNFSLTGVFAYWLIAIGLLIGTLPFPGLLAALVSRFGTFRILAAITLCIGTALLANGIWMIARIESDLVLKARLEPSILTQWYWHCAIANIALAVLVSVILLELLNTYIKNLVASQEIARHNQELEERVKARMIELQEKNASLKAADTELQLLTFELAEKNQILEFALEGISQLNAEGKYVAVNDAYAAVTGFSPAELIGKSWTETVLPKELPRLQELYQEMIRKGKVQTEAIGVKKDGERFYKEVVMIPKKDSKGKMNGHYCFMKDITARKQLEEELRQSLSRVQEMERLFSITGDVICIADREGKFLAVNPAMENILGYRREELEEHSCLEFVFPEDVERTQAELERIAQEGWCDYFENRYHCKDGSFRWFSWTCTTDPDTKKIYAVARDCTERRVTEQELKESFKHLQESEKRRSTYISALTHDLRTPLIAQRHGLSLIGESLSSLDEEEVRFLTSGLLRNNENLLELVNRLLESYQHEDGKIPFSFESVELPTLVQDIMADMGNLAAQKNVVLKHYIPEEMRPVLADKHHLKRVFQNLIGNALEHMPKENGTISVTAYDMKDKIEIQFVDNGKGIDPELLPSLFERYLMGVSKKRKIGSGLGLYICRLIVERHGGTIKAENRSSNSESGAAFIITLPKPPFESLVFEGTGYEEGANA